jgi:hypothetical protein
MMSIYEQQMHALSQFDNENLSSALNNNPFNSPHILSKNKPNKMKPIERIENHMSMHNSRAFNGGGMLMDELPMPQQQNIHY